MKIETLCDSLMDARMMMFLCRYNQGIFLSECKNVNIFSWASEVGSAWIFVAIQHEEAQGDG